MANQQVFYVTFDKSNELEVRDLDLGVVASTQLPTTGNSHNIFDSTYRKVYVASPSNNKVYVVDVTKITGIGSVLTNGTNTSDDIYELSINDAPRWLKIVNGNLYVLSAKALHKFPLTSNGQLVSSTPTLTYTNVALTGTDNFAFFDHVATQDHFVICGLKRFMTFIKVSDFTAVPNTSFDSTGFTLEVNTSAGVFVNSIDGKSDKIEWDTLTYDPVTEYIFATSGLQHEVIVIDTNSTTTAGKPYKQVSRISLKSVENGPALAGASSDIIVQQANNTDYLFVNLYNNTVTPTSGINVQERDIFVIKKSTLAVYAFDNRNAAGYYTNPPTPNATRFQYMFPIFCPSTDLVDGAQRTYIFNEWGSTDTSGAVHRYSFDPFLSGNARFIDDQLIATNDINDPAPDYGFMSYGDWEPADGCGCPPGYTLEFEGQDGCVKITETTAVAPVTPITIVAGDQNTGYGQWGAHFYQTPSMDNLPIVAKGTSGHYSTYPYNPQTYRLEDAAGNVLGANGADIISDIWGGYPEPTSSATLGRLNNAGIWGTGAAVGQWYGFTFCIDNTSGAPKTYCVGFAADNRMRLKIDGNLVIHIGEGGETPPLPTSGQMANFAWWHVIPIVFPAGKSIVHLEGYNDGSSAAFAAEIYDADVATLRALTIAPGGPQSAIEALLAPYILFSTKDQIGQTFDTSTVAANSYSCPAGYALSNCDGVYECTLIEREDWVSCCFELEDCQGVRGSLIIEDASFNDFVGETIVLEEYNGTCWLVKPSLTCTGALPIQVTVVQRYADCQSCLPQCYVLTNCVDQNDTVTTSTDLSAYVTSGEIVKIQGDDRCFTVSGYIICEGDFPEVTVVETFATCDDCRPKCYVLTDCSGEREQRSTNQDLSLVEGQYIKWDGTCWLVTEAFQPCECLIDDVITLSDPFATCELCNYVAPVPPVITKRFIEPGFNTLNCDPEVVVSANLKFADAMYKSMVAKRYGIVFCCEEDLDKAYVEKMKIDLGEKFDPDMCPEDEEEDTPTCP